jgi:hypothetical protein
MNATGDRVQTHRVKLHVSYKKHLLSSYVNSDEAYEPNAAEKNTIATVDSAVFQSGFVEYARYMAGKIIKRGQTEDFRPRDVVLDTKNIAFGNDTGGQSRLGLYKATRTKPSGQAITTTSLLPIFRLRAKLCR